jgi:hypothetical protein
VLFGVAELLTNVDAGSPVASGLGPIISSCSACHATHSLPLEEDPIICCHNIGVCKAFGIFIHINVRLPDIRDELIANA